MFQKLMLKASAALPFLKNKNEFKRNSNSFFNRNSIKPLKVIDFLEKPHDTWTYILEMSLIHWSQGQNRVSGQFVNQLLEDKYNEALFRMQDQAMQFSNRNDVSLIYSHRVL